MVATETGTPLAGVNTLERRFKPRAPLQEKDLERKVWAKLRLQWDSETIVVLFSVGGGGPGLTGGRRLLGCMSGVEHSKLYHKESTLRVRGVWAVYSMCSTQ